MFFSQSGSWGIPHENGTWEGMLGMVQQDKVSTAAAGFVPDTARGEYFDFSVEVMSLKYSLFTRRPTGAAVSVQNYFWEFDRYIWACVAAISLCTFASMFLVLRQDRTERKPSSKALSVVLRALVYKGTPLATSALSAKAVLMTILLLSTVLFVSYRSCLNAFLAVVIPAQRVRGLEDVLSRSAGLAMWPGFWLEKALLNSDSETERELYHKWAEDEDAKVGGFTNADIRTFRLKNLSVSIIW